MWDDFKIKCLRIGSIQIFKHKVFSALGYLRHKKDMSEKYITKSALQDQQLTGLTIL